MRAHQSSDSNKIGFQPQVSGNSNTRCFGAYFAKKNYKLQSQAILDDCSTEYKPDRHLSYTQGF